MLARFRRLSVFGWLIVALAAASVETYAQDLEPRAFANTPVGLNFLIGGYAYAKGTVGTDASVPLEDTEVTLNSAILAYVRTLDLWGRSGKLDVILPYTWASGSAKVAGQPRKRDVSGLGDPRLRFSMLLYGGPALSLDEFRDFEPDVIIGTMLEVTPPLGQYDSDKLLNIGTNRWSFKPEVGISKTLGPLTLELAGLDKVLFTFASYNAGPSRIAQLRQKAGNRGLDPNIWFHHVEYIAADEIGAETVTYVSNIYKYYIAYQLIMEAQAAREKAAEKIKSQSK